MRKLFGLCAQRMTGAKTYDNPRIDPVQVLDLTTGSGTVTVAETCVALIYVWGGGGAGLSSAGGVGWSGAGGGACYKRMKVAKGQVITYSVGAGGTASATGSDVPGGDGGTTTVTLPNGRVLTATGGKKGEVSTSPTPGVGSGGDLNRSGGTREAAGEFGGAAGAGVYAGGGAGGFTDKRGPTGGAGSNGQVAGMAGLVPGGGSAGNHSSVATGAGGAGRLLIVFVRAI